MHYIRNFKIMVPIIETPSFFQSITNMLTLTALAGGIMQNAIKSTVVKLTGHAGAQVWRRIRSLPVDKALPPNHDLLQAVRIAMLNATLYMADAIQHDESANVNDGLKKQIDTYTTALKKWVKEERQTVKKTTQADRFTTEAYAQIELLLGGDKREEGIEEKARLTEVVKQQWQQELKHGLAQDVPELVQTYLNAGWTEHGRDMDWFTITCYWFGQLLKEEEHKKAKAAFEDRLLSEIATDTGIINIKADEALTKMEAAIEHLNYLREKWDDLRQQLDEIKTLVTQTQKTTQKTHENTERILTLLENKSPDLAHIRAVRQSLAQKKTELEARIKQIEERLEQTPNDELLTDALNTKREAWRETYNAIEKLYEEQQQVIAALKRQIEIILNIDESFASERLLKVKRLFTEGKEVDAIALLQTEERDKEIAEFLHNKEITDRTGKSLAEEEMILALSIFKNIENHKRVDQAILHFEMSLKCYTYFENTLEFGNFYLEIGHIDHAHLYYQKAQIIYNKEHHDKNDAYTFLLNNIGLVLKAKGDLDGAISNYEEAIRISILLHGENDSELAAGYNNLGVAWQYKGDLGKAFDYIDKALKINISAHGEENEHSATGYNNLGLILQDVGIVDVAINLINRALQINISLFNEMNTNVATGYNNLGMAYRDKGDFDNAILYLEKSLKVFAFLFGHINANVAMCYNNLGMCWQDKSDIVRAIEYLNKALKINISLLGEKSPFVTRSYNNLATALHISGQSKDAINYLIRALEINISLYGEIHPDIAATYANLGSVYEDIGEVEMSKKYAEKAIDTITALTT